MENFIGDPQRSPMYAIINNCDATVFSNKLCKLAILYKWNTSVFRLVRMHIVFHMLCLGISSVAMIYTTQLHLAERAQADEVSHIMQAITIVSVILNFFLHGLRLLRQGRVRYLLIIPRHLSDAELDTLRDELDAAGYLAP